MTGVTWRLKLKEEHCCNPNALCVGTSKRVKPRLLSDTGIYTVSLPRNLPIQVTSCKLLSDCHSCHTKFTARVTLTAVTGQKKTEASMPTTRRATASSRSSKRPRSESEGAGGPEPEVQRPRKTRRKSPAAGMSDGQYAHSIWLLCPEIIENTIQQLGKSVKDMEGAAGKILAGEDDEMKRCYADAAAKASLALGTMRASIRDRLLELRDTIPWAEDMLDKDSSDEWTWEGRGFPIGFSEQGKLVMGPKVLSEEAWQERQDKQVERNKRRAEKREQKLGLRLPCALPPGTSFPPLTSSDRLPLVTVQHPNGETTGLRLPPGLS